ncbi:MAG TPA: TetR/AcrR family transcriptional regulator [Magnetospirillaceae bacterium]|nr:TetR/AcrR family transcriptional regulator [Magnetospirillaceae bacterium]
MTVRPYHSPRRSKAAEETRRRLIEAAGALLAEGIVSMEAVARAAKVTRLTVYKQFGSRRALFEAVFDERALQGGLKRIPEVMALEDPRIALEKLIEIFCAFYAGDPAISRIHDACAADEELRQTMEERAERRRKVLGVLLGRLGPARQDDIDLLFALTTLPVYQSLSAGRTPEETCDLIKAASFAIISSTERHNSDIKRD